MQTDMYPYYAGTKEKLAEKILDYFDDYEFGMTLGLDADGELQLQYNDRERNYSQFQDKGLVCRFFGTAEFDGIFGVGPLVDYAWMDEDSYVIIDNYDEFGWEDDDEEEHQWRKHEYTREEMIDLIAKELDVACECEMAHVIDDDEERDIGGEHMEYKLTRHGQAPLAFDGDSLADDYDRPTNRNGYPADRWSEYELYRTDSDKYVLAIHTFSRYQGEGNEKHAYYADTAKELFDLVMTGTDDRGEAYVYESDRERNRVVALFEEAGLGDEIVEEI